MPSTGYLPKEMKALRAASFCASGATDRLIMASPRNSMPKPRTTSPLFFSFCFFAKKK